MRDTYIHAFHQKIPKNFSGFCTFVHLNHCERFPFDTHKFTSQTSETFLREKHRVRNIQSDKIVTSSKKVGVIAVLSLVLRICPEQKSLDAPLPQQMVEPKTTTFFFHLSDKKCCKFSIRLIVHDMLQKTNTLITLYTLNQDRKK